MVDHVRLCEWMMENNITNLALAKNLGITQSAVSQIRTGKNQMSGKGFKRLLECYPDLSARWLILGEGKSSRKVGTREGVVEGIKYLVEEIDELRSMVQEKDLQLDYFKRNHNNQ